MKTFRERQTPSIWLVIAGLLFIPAVLLALTPISFALAVPVSLAVYAAFLFFLFATSPVIEVAGGELRAGRATLPLSLVGNITILDAERTRALLTVESDARAYLVIRSWIPRSVRVEVNDPADATPFWLITSRHPEKLAAALSS